MKPYRIVIFSTPRSGTRYVAERLQEIGLCVGHEQLWPHGGCGYMFVDPSRRPPYKEIEVVGLLTRDPCYSIPSAEANLTTDGWEDRVMFECWSEWWVRWMTMCQRALLDAKRAGCKTIQFAIEEAESGVSEIARLLDLSPCVLDKKSSVSRALNHRKDYKPMRPEELSADVHRIRDELGYGVPTEQGVWLEA